jgi:hypothetical protein
MPNEVHFADTQNIPPENPESLRAGIYVAKAGAACTSKPGKIWQLDQRGRGRVCRDGREVLIELPVSL